jgi:hypothetical protein
VDRSEAPAGGGPAGAGRFRELLITALERPHGEGDPDQSKIPAHLFKVSGLANGAVSVVFHVPFEHADMALGLHHLRGQAISFEITMGWEE